MSRDYLSFLFFRSCRRDGASVVPLPPWVASSQRKSSPITHASSPGSTRNGKGVCQAGSELGIRRIPLPAVQKATWWQQRLPCRPSHPVAEASILLLPEERFRPDQSPFARRTDVKR